MSIEKAHILLVDDLEANLIALSALFQREDVRLLQAHSGQEALEMLLIHDVALAIVDVRMPLMDGFELAELMRGAHRTRHVPIIFLTAETIDNRRRFRGYEAGAVDFLFKPIEPDVLCSKADVFLQLYWQRRELECQRDELRVIADANAKLAAEKTKSQEELQKAQEELRRYAATLEQLVQERTAKLMESVADMESFSYSIVHDMRAPLRSMQGFSSILSETYSDALDETGRGYLDRISAAAMRMDQLITDVLSYSKVVRGDTELRPVNLASVLADILDGYPQFRESQAKITVRRPLPQVIGNEAMLTQVFSNLLGNAVKFVAPGVRPEVTVWAEPHAARTRIQVKDNGIGIATDQQEKIFGIFQRVGRDYEGTGIGLAIVKKAVLRMNGAVGVESRPGRGSTFWVELNPAN